MKRAFLMRINNKFIIKNVFKIGVFYSDIKLNNIISFSINNIEYVYDDSSKEILENSDIILINFIYKTV